MPDLFHIKIITPEKTFFDGDAQMLVVRTTDGELGVMAHHISMVTNLPSSPLRVQNENGAWHTASLSQGLLKVGENTATVIADAIEWAEDIDIEWAKRSERNAREKLGHLTAGEFDYELAQLKLRRALNRQNVKSMG
jgi:F-type H+-transporting ATPase subunit epsilon